MKKLLELSAQVAVTEGGGSEMLIIEQHLSDVRLYDDGISPTLNTATGGGEYR